MKTATARSEKKTQAGTLLASDASMMRAAGFVADDMARESDRAVVEGIVLAGVHSWGNSPLDRVACWPLVPVAGEPLLTHTIKWLGGAGIRNVSICANSDTLYVSRALSDGRDCGAVLEYYEDRLPRGPAGCIRDVIMDRLACVFVVIDASVLPRIDLQALLEAHHRSGALLTVAAIRGGDDMVSRRRLLPAGVYVCSKRIAEYIGRTGYQDVKERLVPHLHAKGVRVHTHVVGSEALPRVRCAASYLTVNRWMIEALVRNDETESGYRKQGEARVHRTARVASDAKLIGPVLIGPGCGIERDAVIVGPTSIGAGSQVGKLATVSRSALWSSCRIGAGAVVDDCVLADNAVIDDGIMQRNAVCVATD